MRQPFPVSDHCDGRRFFNPAGSPRALPFTAVPRWWWRQRTVAPAAAWPKELPPAREPELPAAVAPGSIAVTWIGHATFLLQLAGVNVITDPVFAPHAGPSGRFGPKRVRPPALPLERLPRIDLVLLSHNHYDHLDLAALRVLSRRDRPRIVTTLGNDAWLVARDVEGAIALDWWESTRPSDALEVVCTPAQHFSARVPWDRNRTLWGGFVLKCDAGTIYFAGDSGFGTLFEAIGARLGPFDLALIPIGAYEPRWFMQPVHVNPDEAVRAHLALRSRRSIGMHFGTFQLTDEAIDAPLVALADARAQHGVAEAEFGTLEHGETWVQSGI